MKDLIIETDLGRDPDDLWAILYLISTGVQIRAITVAPGDPDQIAIASFLREYLELDFLIGSGEPCRQKSSTRGVYHRDILAKYQFPLEVEADDVGADVIKKVMTNFPECDLVVIGPVTSVGQHLRDNPTASIDKATMQGGFIGYHVHGLECDVVDKFVGKTKVQTFNLNASKELAFDFLGANINQRSFVGKHICHGVVYDEQLHEKMLAVEPKNKAADLLRDVLGMYLDKHPGGKKFHDPLAAVCHLHPEIATYVKGSLYKEKGEWGVNLADDGDDIAIAIDMEKFWHHIMTST